MKALRLKSWKSEPVLEDVPVPEPGPGEVLVQVGAAGACHSDLHLMHDFEADTCPGPRRSRSATRTPAGCTRSARASAASRSVSRSPWSAPGAAAPAPGAWTACETYCERPDLAPVPGGGGGLGLDGGMAEYLLVPAARHLVPLPDGLDPVDGRAAHRRRAHAVPRDPPLQRQARPRRHGDGHRRRRPRPPRRADPEGDHRRTGRSPSTPASRPGTWRSPAARTWCSHPATTWSSRSGRRPEGTAPTSCSTSSAPTTPWPPALRAPASSVTSPSSASRAARCPCRSSACPTRRASRRRTGATGASSWRSSTSRARDLLHAEKTIFTLDDAARAYDELAHGTVRGRAVVVPHDSFQA